MTKPTAVIIEMDEERDRKACLALDLKVTGANRELAQWLADHPRYSDITIAGWLGCGKSRVNELRRWAKEGFEGAPHNSKQRQERVARHAGQEPLKTNDNSESEEEQEIAPPEQIEENLHYYLDRINRFAAIFKKHFRLSSFDREAETRIITAIDRMIEKWRSTQSIIIRRGHHG